MKENIIVTGGAGFLGSHVADCLIEQGYNVTVSDIRPSPYLKMKSPQKQVQGDLRDIAFVKKLLEGQSVVYHMAGLADIDDCDDQPVLAAELNILGTLNVLEACVYNKIKKILFASSAYVSSDKGSFYRVTKHSCENFIKEYHKKHNLDFVILRYGTLYGERSGMKNSVYRLLKQAILTKRMIYSGTGEERRDLIHVKDASQLSVKAMDEKYINSNILLSGLQTIKYSDLLHIIKEILGGDIEIEFERKGSNTHYMMTPYSYVKEECRKLLGDNQIDLGQGLCDLIDEISGK